MKVKLEVDNLSEFQREAASGGDQAGLAFGRSLQARVQAAADAATARLEKMADRAAAQNGRADQRAADRQQRAQAQADRALVPRGPLYRLGQAQAMVRAAEESGDQGRIFDARHNLRRTESAADRAQNGPRQAGVGERLERFMRSSRFGAGPLQPLVGQGLDLVGLGKFAGPVGIATAAVTLWAREVRNATESLYTFRAATMASGGSSAEVAGIQGAGVAPGEIAARAAAIRSARANDPMAALVGSQYGLGPALPRPFGDTDEAKDLQQLIRALRSMRPGSPEQIRLARAFGQEDLLASVNVGPQFRAVQENIAANQERLYGGAEGGPQEAASNVVAGEKNLGQAWTNAWVASGGQALWADTLNGLADMVNRLAGGGDAQDGGQSEQAKTNELLAEQNRMLAGVLKQGSYGLGPRGQAALSRIPWRGALSDRAFEEDARLRGLTG